MKNKITLVKGASWRSDFETLELPSIEFARLFIPFDSAVEVSDVPLENIVVKLPPTTQAIPTTQPPEGHIAVNAADQRIDQKTSGTSASGWRSYHELPTKPCTRYHLEGHCQYDRSCRWSHEPLAPGHREVMQILVRRVPCSQGSHCRSPNCWYGHVCMRFECNGVGSECPFGPQMHNIDMTVARWVPPVDTGFAEPERGVIVGSSGASVASENLILDWSSDEEVA